MMDRSSSPWQNNSKKGHFMPVRIEWNLLFLCQQHQQLFPRNFTIHTCRASALGYALTCSIIKTFTRPSKLLPSAPIYLLFQFIPEKVQELLFVLQKESISHALVGAKMPELQPCHGVEVGELCQGCARGVLQSAWEAVLLGLARTAGLGITSVLGCMGQSKPHCPCLCAESWKMLVFRRCCPERRDVDKITMRWWVWGTRCCSSLALKPISIFW